MSVPPQVWYLDLFAGTNDYEAADRGGSGGHKDINRTNLSVDDIDAGLGRPIVLAQLEMIRLRNTSAAFDGDLEVVATEPHRLVLRWKNGDTRAELDADLATETFAITHQHDAITEVLDYNKRDVGTSFGSEG